MERTRSALGQRPGLGTGMPRTRSALGQRPGLGTGMPSWHAVIAFLLPQALLLCCVHGRASNSARLPDWCCSARERGTFRSRSLQEWSQPSSGSGDDSTDGSVVFTPPTYGPQQDSNSTIPPPPSSSPAELPPPPPPSSSLVPPEAETPSSSAAELPPSLSSSSSPVPSEAEAPAELQPPSFLSPRTTSGSNSSLVYTTSTSPRSPESTSSKPRRSLPPSSSTPMISAAAPSPRGSISRWCTSIVREMVVAPDDGDLYYVLDERCESGNETDHVLLSISQARTSLITTGAVNQSDERSMVSRWWPASMANGTKFEEPISVQTGGNASAQPMSYATGMGLSPSGTHLVLTTVKMGGEGVQPTMTTLSIRSGLRSSVPIPVHMPVGLALDRSAKPPQLFIAGKTGSGLRIASASVDDIGLPLAAAQNGAWLVLNWIGGGNDSSVQTGVLGPQSIVADGSCLYFLNKEKNNNSVMGLDLRSSAGHVTLVAGSARQLEGAPDDGISGQHTSFGELRQLVTTSDGCNLFATEFLNNNGFIRWIKLRSPCGPAVSVESPFTYKGKSLVGLALEDHDDRSLRLHVGANDGLLFSVDIVKSTLQPCWRRDASGNRSLAIVLPVVLAVVVTAALGFIAGFLFWKRGRRPLAEKPQQEAAAAGTATAASSTLYPSSGTPLRVSSSATSGGTGSACDRGDIRPCPVKRYSIATLAHYTCGFSEDYRVGEAGAFGAVYYGFIDELHAAIKVMTGELTAEKRVQFAAEVNTLRRLHHSSLIHLIGYCDEGDRCVLVYPYYHGGSLDGRLHNRQRVVTGKKPPVAPLTLEERVSVGIQIAKALSYLHDGATPPVLHRDIKSSNVLLGDGEGKNIHAVLADFGLATIGERILHSTHEQFVLTSHIAGTFGYMAPEYMLRGELSEKNDVYAFGVLVLELLTGRRAAWKSPSGVGWQTLVEWARPFLDDERRRDPDINLPDAILDPCLQNEAAGASARTMVIEIGRLAWCCVSEEPENRPRMGVVLQRLQTIVSGWAGGFW